MSTKNLAYVSIFAAITAVCAQIFINLPFTPVPVTLQVLAVFLSGALLGSRLGAMSQIVYLLLGAIGIPVFASFSGGFHILVGYTGGYLLSYPIASYLIGKISNLYKGDSPVLKNVTTGFSMVIGLIVIYLLGASQYALVANVSFIKSISVTVIPFIIPDLMKLLVAVALTYPVKNALLKSKLLPASN
ncbi:biotin transporter BioY [Thermohalobacter berrensis]|uniref:Biotin transporter n=1 Tax=Thermohalobacter berrensis TaxID=99594 RepID=A0A419T4Q0_9FIRM|nr:biotin transporter BioY [Thermohalobacter berrensis]RKD32358.1 hypothetical protein BET03_03360 [Thermohalobacter berrensis]